MALALIAAFSAFMGVLMVIMSLSGRRQTAVEARVQRLAPHVRRLLMLAGDPFSPSGFFFLMAISAVSVPGLYLLLVLQGGSFGALHFLGLLLFIGLGFSAPYIWLTRRVSGRRNPLLTG